MTEVFTSKKLNSLYTKGKLNEIINKYKEVVNYDNFLGCGDDACGFEYDKNTVLKICSKKIGYFRETKNYNATHLMDFVKNIKCLLPIKKLLYEDKDFFVYLQNKCEMFDRKNITVRMVLHILRMLVILIQNNVIIKISPHNLGFFNKYVIIFDYHGMKPIKILNNIIDDDLLKNILTKNLTRYILTIYNPEKKNQYLNLLKNDVNKFNNTIINDKTIPKCLIKILNYFNQNHLFNKNDLIKLINNCYDFIYADKINPENKNKRSKVKHNKTK